MTRPLLIPLLCAAFFGLSTALFTVTPASADTRKLAPVSPAQLQSACEKAGGTFSPPSGTGEVEGAYACGKANCDGKGGRCVVSCDGNQNCYGSTPMQLTVNQTLLSILQNGDRVSRYYAPLTTAGGGRDDNPAPGPADPGGGGGGGDGCGLPLC
jgi:hypothetical protein